LLSYCPGKKESFSGGQGLGIYFADKMTQEERWTLRGSDYGSNACSPSKHLNWLGPEEFVHGGDLCEYCKRIRPLDRAIERKDRERLSY
jgi:hypothetical protein